MDRSGILFSHTRLFIKMVLKCLLMPVGLLIPGKNNGLRVLFYHRVNSFAFHELGLVSRETTVRETAFERQLAHLARCGYRSVTVDEFEKMRTGKQAIDPKAILITFDDGYADNLECAAPLLKKYGFTAIVFVVTDMIGSNNAAWPMSDAEEFGQMMDVQALHQWLAEGHEIGSHTCSHPNLTTLGVPALQRELSESRSYIETEFKHPCTAFAYPTGDVNDQVADAVKSAGYSLAFTTRSGVNKAQTHPLRINRTEVSASDPYFIFCVKIRGVYDWLGFRDTMLYRNTLRKTYTLFARNNKTNHKVTT